eukprot:TRINITY_DN8593_c0_g1_i2.p1 TRINITY_DN8593_c0_g1~~TRINITY_DN8593_c0_g1_i2.p1  ORF type:complete len:423 (+),score=133.30 TRINITY_DN8593_c0_g1_i2:68-1270(+)
MQDDDVRSPLDPDTPLVPFNGRVVVPWLARDVAAQLVGGSRVALATTAQGLDLTIQLETPESARRLRPLRPERVTRLEAMLFDTFIQQDDGYERDRFLLTATVRGTRRLAGLIFWRNIHSAEMRSWLDPEIADLSEAAGRAAVAAAPGSAPAAAAAPPPPFGQRALVPGAVTFPVVPLGGWVQIELVATNPSMRGQGIGKLLLALALAYAVVRSSKRSALLLVAGGGENSAAEALYRKFGFVAPPKGYVSPAVESSNLRVVWDVASSLSDLAEEGDRVCGSAGAPAGPAVTGPGPGPHAVGGDPRTTRQLCDFLRQRGVGWGDCVERSELLRRVQGIEAREAAAAGARAGSPSLPEAEEDLWQLPVRELQRRLDALGIAHGDCLEKGELVARLAAAARRV